MSDTYPATGLDTDRAVLAVARMVTPNVWIERPSGFATMTPCIVLTPLAGRGSGHGLHEDVDYTAECWATSRAEARRLANDLRGAIRAAWLVPPLRLHSARTRNLPAPQVTGVDGLWRFDLDFSAVTRLAA